MTSRPLIGIVGEVVEDPHALRLPLRYGAAVERAGGVPFAVLHLAGDEYRDALLSVADGFVIAGGDDWDTESLGLGPTHGEAKPVPRLKQEFDLALARGALAAGIPVLGICYGMQCLGLAEGARLLQHLPADRPGSRPHSGGVVHRVGIEAGSKLASLVGAPSVDVVSKHHQALETLGAGWSVSGRDDEGLIEACERGDHPFALGVQWHPELSPGNAAQEALFRGLVTAALAHRARRPRRGAAAREPAAR
jgi:gamma-glutamyl-gamma-aminobutyrate hydrolase PuuD